MLGNVPRSPATLLLGAGSPAGAGAKAARESLFDRAVSGQGFMFSVSSGCALSPKIPALLLSELNGMMSRISPRCVCSTFAFPLLCGVSQHLPWEPLLSAGDNKGKEQHLKPNKTHTPSSAFVPVAMGTPYMHRKRWSMQMRFLISSPQSFMLLVQQFDH